MNALAASVPSTGPRLSVHGKVTLNRQIARDLTDRIDRGELAPGHPLPSESELATAYGVNRLTVRHALSELVHQGLVSTARGRRAFVTVPPVRYRLDETPGASLTASMAKQGLLVFHELLAADRVGTGDAPLPISGKRLARFHYRRWVDGLPWSSSYTWLMASLAPRTWDGTRPLLDEVAQRHGLEIRRATRSFVAEPAGFDVAELLDVAVGAPLLLVTGTSLDQHGRTVAVVRHHTRGDRAEYVVNLAR